MVATRARSEGLISTREKRDGRVNACSGGMFDAGAKGSRGSHDCIETSSGSFWSVIEVRLAES